VEAGVIRKPRAFHFVNIDSVFWYPEGLTHALVLFRFEQIGCKLLVDLEEYFFQGSNRNAVGRDAELVKVLIELCEEVGEC